MDFSIVDLIERKRDGGSFTALEIEWMISTYTNGGIPDYQMSALLMAIFLKGLSAAELAGWTDAMLNSGDVLNLSAVPKPKVDKHSTGGVGDKVSLPLAPMVAACGVAVPMISGRGLGHTGGTLDKLETIPGFRTELDPTEFVEVLQDTGIVMAGQSATLAPADRLLYALRDVTGTVPSIDLIASSIMSKKLTEDLDGLVLDVKVGSGAFMKHEPGARKLAKTMVEIGKAHDTQVVALLTDMTQPLGHEVGNANEMAESVAVLRGEGPEDLTELVYRLGEEMLLLAGVDHDRHEARDRLRNVVASGHAFETFKAVAVAQGGDPKVLDNPALLPMPRHSHRIVAPASGYITRCDALDIGTGALRLGAGRDSKEATIDPAVGITVLQKRGDRVEEGQPVAMVGYNDESRLMSALPLVEQAWEVGDEPPPPRPLIIGEVR